MTKIDSDGSTSVGVIIFCNINEISDNCHLQPTVPPPGSQCFAVRNIFCTGSNFHRIEFNYNFSNSIISLPFWKFNSSLEICYQINLRKVLILIFHLVCLRSIIVMSDVLVIGLETWNVKLIPLERILALIHWIKILFLFLFYHAVRMIGDKTDSYWCPDTILLVNKATGKYTIAIEMLYKWLIKFSRPMRWRRRGAAQSWLPQLCPMGAEYWVAGPGERWSCRELSVVEPEWAH